MSKIELTICYFCFLKVFVKCSFLQLTVSHLYFQSAVWFYVLLSICLQVFLYVYVKGWPTSVQFYYHHLSQSHHHLSPGLLKTCFSSFNSAPSKSFITQQSNFKKKNLNQLSHSTAKARFDFHQTHEHLTVTHEILRNLAPPSISFLTICDSPTPYARFLLMSCHC